MDVRVGHKKAERKRIDAFELMVLEKTLESPLDCKEIQPVHPKGDQSWVFIGRTEAEADTPILWPPDAKRWLIGNDPDAGGDWGQEEKRTTEDEMAGWHHRLEGHEFEQTLGVGDGQGGLACCDSWGRKESDTTDRLNWTEQPRGVGKGGRFEREGTYVHLWLIHADVWQKSNQYCKAIILQLKTNVMEEEMAMDPSILAWNISRTEEPGRPQSMGLQRVRHDWVTELSMSLCMHLCHCIHPTVIWDLMGSLGKHFS